MTPPSPPSISTTDLVAIARKAGRAIMKIYTGDSFGTTFKDNNQPLTLADTAANAVILEELQAKTPDLPILTEEAKAIPYEERGKWSDFWMVDPLDGTKEFIKRNGDFTVNIALIQNHLPVLSVVHAPDKRWTYYAKSGEGAYRIEGEGSPKRIEVLRDTKAGLRVIMSLSHQTGEGEAFLKKLGDCECLNIGSSLKFCLVAEGKVHLYPRFGPTMEWDTAAAHGVVKEAGATVTDFKGQELHYNKEDLHNPFFIVSSLPELFWKPLISGK